MNGPYVTPIPNPAQAPGPNPEPRTGAGPNPGQAIVSKPDIAYRPEC